MFVRPEGFARMCFLRGSARSAAASCATTIRSTRCSRGHETYRAGDSVARCVRRRQGDRAPALERLEAHAGLVDERHIEQPDQDRVGIRVERDAAERDDPLRGHGAAVGVVPGAFVAAASVEYARVVGHSPGVTVVGLARGLDEQGCQQDDPQVPKGARRREPGLQNRRSIGRMARIRGGPDSLRSSSR
jgi:hypothetical protein